MEDVLTDRFIVFVRDDRRSPDRPQLVERELVTCPTYEEARWIRQEYGRTGRKCIIRYVGPAGGGD